MSFCHDLKFSAYTCCGWRSTVFQFQLPGKQKRMKRKKIQYTISFWTECIDIFPYDAPKHVCVRVCILALMCVFICLAYTIQRFICSIHDGHIFHRLTLNKRSLTYTYLRIFSASLWTNMVRLECVCMMCVSGKEQSPKIPFAQDNTKTRELKWRGKHKGNRSK